MSVLARCGTCERAWSAAAQAHCVSCHEQFNSVTAFDRHRTGPADARRCIPVKRFAAPHGKPREPLHVRTGTEGRSAWATALRVNGETATGIPEGAPP